MTLPSHCSVRKALLFAALFWLAVMVSGCQTTLPHYPTAWPELVALSAGGTELNGIYGNEGTLIMETGEQRPIKLTSLMPTIFFPTPSGDPVTPVSSRFAETKTVSLKVRNPSKENGASEKPWGYSQKSYAIVRTLEFSSDVENGAETVPVEGLYWNFKNSDKQLTWLLHPSLRIDAIQYVQGGQGVSFAVVAGEETRSVYLTKSADGSLIAGIEDIDFMLYLFVPTYSHSLTWASFPRIGD